MLISVEFFFAEAAAHCSVWIITYLSELEILIHYPSCVIFPL